jgi:predicted branched-subunit amino acid permease
MRANRGCQSLRPSLPLALPTSAMGLTFGLLAAPVIGVPAAFAMSALIWSGTAQFAALTVLAAGGGVWVAAGAGLLGNTRYLPMGFAIAPDVTGSAWRRAANAAALADASFVMARRVNGGFDPHALVWAAPVQYLSWVGGTVVGATAAGSIVDPARWGLDVLFPVFYITIATTPVLPAGLPIVLAAAAALIGARK